MYTNIYSGKPNQTNIFDRKLTQLYIQETQNKLIYFRELYIQENPNKLQYFWEN